MSHEKRSSAVEALSSYVTNYQDVTNVKQCCARTCRLITAAGTALELSNFGDLREKRFDTGVAQKIRVMLWIATIVASKTGNRCLAHIPITQFQFQTAETHFSRWLFSFFFGQSGWAFFAFFWDIAVLLKVSLMAANVKHYSCMSH
jgi:hypothetical protein